MYKVLLLLVLTTGLCNNTIVAQGFRGNNSFNNAANGSNSKDTTKLTDHKHEDYSIKIFTTSFYNATPQGLDTGITFLHRDKYLNIWQQHLGNNGSAVWSINPSFGNNKSIALGQTTYAPYILNVDSVKFYNTTKPYTEFWYKAGTQREQGGELFHTQNFGQAKSISLRYSKYVAPGFFKNQFTNHTHFITTWQHQAIGKQRWSLQAAVAANQTKQDENGGIVTDSVLGFSEFSLRTTVPINIDNGFNLRNRSNIINTYGENAVKIKNDITLFFKTSGDSIKTYTPLFQIQHNLQYTGEKYTFKDEAPTRARYANLDTIAIGKLDSVYAYHQLHTLQNDFGAQLPNLFKGKTVAYAAIGIENQWYKTLVDKTNYLYNYIKFNLRNSNTNDTWQYNGNGNIYITGKAAGNYHIMATASRKYKNYNLQLWANQSLQNGTWIQNNFVSNYYNINTTLYKVFTTQFGANLKWYNTQLQVANKTCYGYIYWDSSYKVQQVNGLVNLASVQINNAIKYKQFTIYNNVLLQKANTGAPLNIPLLAEHLQISYENMVYKKSIRMHIGLDVYYNSAFITPIYLPFINQFGYGTTYKQNNLPRVGFFFSTKVKGFRFYLLLDELQQPINFSQNRLLLDKYPATDFMARVGFCWSMVN